MEIRKRLTSLDWEKWKLNTLTFLAPLGLLYLFFVKAQIDFDGFQTTDFIPTSEVIGAMVLYLINTVVDFLKKYKAAI